MYYEIGDMCGVTAGSMAMETVLIVVQKPVVVSRLGLFTVFRSKLNYDLQNLQYIWCSWQWLWAMETVLIGV